MDSIEKILEQVDREMERAIENPEAFDFREKTPYKVPIAPQHRDMDTGTVDLENQNVKVRYSLQNQRENYVCVKHIPDENTGETDIALVESNSVQDIQGQRVTSRIHYLVDGDEIYRFTNKGYEQTLQTRPQELANQFEDLYRQAMEKDNQRQASQDKGSSKKVKQPVPPPEDGEMFTG